jgi:hypothetical protein
MALGVTGLHAGDLAALLDAECAQLPAVPRRPGTAHRLVAAALLLDVVLARGDEIDAQQRGASQRDDDRGADGAEDVGDARTPPASRRASPGLSTPAARSARLMASVARPIDAEIVCEPA